MVKLYPAPICFSPFSLSLLLSFALPLRWTRFYFLLCCEFINKTCICDTRARNACRRLDSVSKGRGVAGQIPAREQKPEAMHRRRRRFTACPCRSCPPLLVVARPVIVFATRRGCEKLRLAFRACFSFGADIYFAVVNFKLPSMLSTCHMPLACHADIGRAAQREPINCRKLLAKYALRIYCAFWLGYCGGFKYVQDMQYIHMCPYKADSVYKADSATWYINIIV